MGRGSKQCLKCLAGSHKPNNSVPSLKARACTCFTKGSMASLEEGGPSNRHMSKGSVLSLARLDELTTERQSLKSYENQ